MVSSAGCCTSPAGVAIPDTEPGILRPFPSSPRGWKATAPVGKRPGLGTGQGPSGTEPHAPRRKHPEKGASLNVGSTGVGSRTSHLLRTGTRGASASPTALPGAPWWCQGAGKSAAGGRGWGQRGAGCPPVLRGERKGSGAPRWGGALGHPGWTSGTGGCRVWEGRRRRQEAAEDEGLGKVEQPQHPPAD